MDISILRVLEALMPGPATPGLLATRYGMTVSESHEALAAAIEEGLACQVGPLAFELTPAGQRAAFMELPSDRRERGLAIGGRLHGRDLALRRLDP